MSAATTLLLVLPVTLLYVLLKVPLWRSWFTVWYANRKGTVVKGAKLANTFFLKGNPDARARSVRVDRWMASYRYRVNDQEYFYSRLLYQKPPKKVTLYYLPWRPGKACMEGQKFAGIIPKLIYAMALIIFLVSYFRIYAYR